MLKRRGFTLIELLVAVVLLGIVGLTVARVLTSMLRVTQAQVLLARSQGTARTGSLALPSEFREIGYDTIPGITNQSDLAAIAAHRLTFRAMRGMGVSCAVTFGGANGGMDAIWIRIPTWGMNDVPATTDSLLVFVENDRNQGGDDQWVPIDVQDIDKGATCGADNAIKLTLKSEPTHLPAGSGGNSVVNGAQFFVGAPVRWFEQMEYGPVIDATTGKAYVGARSINKGQNTLSPVLGPIPDTLSFALTYYDVNGNVLNPATATKFDVRSIGIDLTGTTSSGISLGGGSSRARGSSAIFTRVALRNVLRP
jgi:prepilin-type N-terminal cleavage/methylation domain-containing protein